MDPLYGEANFDINREDRHSLDEDYLDLELDGRPINRPTKLLDFEERLRTSIRNKTITTTGDAYLFAMREGFLARHAKKVIKEMIDKKELRNVKKEICVSYDAYKDGKSVILLING